ncbi:MAG: hypothetical protein ABL901_02850 [Hyphomicrobiaceae bacterium]|nr:hypothetical protein [Hyphomicrobiaceae bacterium]
MTLQKRNGQIQWAALVIGYLMIVAVAYLNTYDDIRDVGFMHPRVLSVWILALGAAFGATVFEIMRANGKWIAAIFAIIGIIAGEGYGFVKSAERILTDEATKDAHIVKANNPGINAEERKAKAENSYGEALAKADKARTANGCNDACLTYERRAAEAKRELEKAEKDLAAVGPYQVSSRLSVTTGINHKIVSLVPALAFPTALVLMGIVLIAFGSSPLEVKTVVPEVSAPTTNDDGDGTRAPVVIEPITSPAKSIKKAKREQEAVAWIRDYTREHGHPPAFKVVQSEMRLSGTKTSAAMEAAGVERKRRNG